jgi:hypothetical protein
MKDPKNKGKDMEHVKKLIIAMISFQDYLENVQFERDNLTYKESNQIDEYSDFTHTIIQSFKTDNEIDVDVFLSQYEPSSGIDVDAFMQRGRDYEKQFEEKEREEKEQPVLGQFERAIKPRIVPLIDDVKEREGREEKEPMVEPELESISRPEPELSKMEKLSIEIKIKRGEISSKMDKVRKEIEHNDNYIQLMGELIKSPTLHPSIKSGYEKEIAQYRFGDKKLKIKGNNQLKEELKILNDNFEKLGEDYKKIK